jgi:hypothetical protein
MGEKIFAAVGTILGVLFLVWFVPIFLFAMTATQKPSSAWCVKWVGQLLTGHWPG